MKTDKEAAELMEAAKKYVDGKYSHILDVDPYDCFIAGCKHKEESRWIPVTEKNPDVVGYYQVYCNDGCILTAHVAINGWWTLPFGGYYGDLGPEFVRDSKSHEREVTHWMPLPTPPQTNK